jgi:hypothetical protein
MVRYKVFIGPPQTDLLLNTGRDDFTWHTAVGDMVRPQDSEEEEEVLDLYANTIFGQNNSAHELRSWDFYSSSLPGLYPSLD